MKKPSIKKFIPALLFFSPLLTMAAHSYGRSYATGSGYGSGTDIQDLIWRVTEIVQSVVPLLMSLALIYFVWGVIQYIRAGDSEEDREKARNVIVYGVIGLFAIVAVWGLVEMIGYTFNIDMGGNINIPQF